ncbi:glutaredoxin family protein [Chloroflexota bacterium]
MTKSSPQIILYIRPWCGTVMRARRWLEQREIPYTEIDITKDAEAARIVEELNGGNQSVPTILVDGVHVATEPSTEKLERLFGDLVQS